MTLKGPQQEKVYKALLTAFKEPELERLLRFKLDVELTEVAGGDDYRDVVARLVRWSCSENSHLDVIRVAHDKRPDCPELQAIAQEFLKQPKPIQVQETGLPCFPEACEFDLTLPIKQAIAHLDDKSGLVGLAIPCVEASFPSKFCARLKKRLGRKNTAVRDPLKLDYRSSVTEVLRRIKRYENNLRNGRDVICPIEVSASSLEIVEHLWTELSEHFQELHTDSRLILFLYGRECGAFPLGIQLIDPPVFDAMDARDWAYDIVERLKWKEETWKTWKQCMVDYCCKEEGTEVLDIYWVYEHLDFSMRLLQSQVQEQDFIQKLELGP